MDNNKKKKVIIISVIATLLLILLIGGTIAYFGWSGDESLVDVTVSSGTGSCTKLSDNNILLEPTSTKEKGRILKMTAKQEMARNAFITWDLVVNSALTTSGLKHSSFKYELVNDTTAVSYGTGNFENATQGTTITFSTDKETLDINTEYTFILYLWIDGTIGNNPLDMANQSFDFDISCNITGTDTKVTPPDTYEIANGDGTTYTPSYSGTGTKAVKSTASLSKFREVRIDEAVVDSSNYTLTEGSTIVTFKDSYLKSLSVGDHILKIVSTDGLASGILTIKAPSVATYITNIYTEATKTTVTNNSITYNYANIYDVDDDSNTSGGLMNDRLGGTTSDYNAGNIRYYGAKPNNYIYFNCSDYANQSDTTCEKWRIIGVFDDKVKIIRNESIGDFSWDNKDTSTGAESKWGKNDWKTARLMKLLNPSNYYTVDANDNGYGQSLYYTAQSGTCYSGQNNATKSCDFTSTGLKNDTTRNMIEEVTWNLGGWNSSSVYSNQIYSYERGTTVYPGRPTSWTGKIALMYSSDYGYATDFTKCSSDLYDYGTSTDSYACRTNDWLFNSSLQWLLTLDTSNAHSARFVGSSGFVGNGSSVFGAKVVRPVLYLNSEATIESGDGTSNSPYRLSVS